MANPQARTASFFLIIVDQSGYFALRTCTSVWCWSPGPAVWAVGDRGPGGSVSLAGAGSRLAARLHTWPRDDIAVLEAAEPAMPVEDRAADTWEPLIAIADHAGGTLARPRPHSTDRVANRSGRHRRRTGQRPDPTAARLSRRVRHRDRPTHDAAAATPSRPRGPLGRVRATRRSVTRGGSENCGDSSQSGTCRAELLTAGGLAVAVCVRRVGNEDARPIRLAWRVVKVAAWFRVIGCRGVCADPQWFLW